jgi:hypothetical protein
MSEYERIETPDESVISRRPLSPESVLQHYRESRPITNKAARSPLIILGVVTLYALLFEWQIFQGDVLLPAVNVAKLIIPVLMLVLIPIRRAPSRPLRLFFLFFLLFMIWGLVPSLLAEQFQETVSTWLKYASRLLFAFLVGLYVLRQPQASLQLMKVLVTISVLTVIQFLLLVFFYSLDMAKPFFISGITAIHYGPYGLLGNQTAVQSFAEIPFPIFRLTGYWFEPSTASGFLFASFFLARIVHGVEKKFHWRLMSYVCCVGGFLALSNAGYLAIAAPMFFAALFMKKAGGKLAYVVILGLLSLGLAYFALQGRVLVNEKYASSGELKALSGARAGSEIDPYGGRTDLLQKSWEVLTTQPFGIGMRVPGEGYYEQASASAPVQWLTFTGFVGLILLLLREYQLLRTAIRYARDSPLIMSAAQAWIAICTQHLVYGTWMTPFYLILATLVISTTHHAQQNAFGDYFAAGAVPLLNEVQVLPPSGRRVLDRAAASSIS